MKFKQFMNWCNDRACDGCWGMGEALYCLGVIDEVMEQPFWKREKKWNEMNVEYSIERNIVNPTNQKIAQLSGGENNA